MSYWNSLPWPRRPAYVAFLAEHVLPGGRYLLYAFEWDLELAAEGSGLSVRDLACLAPAFSLRWAQHGQDRGRPSAWYLFERSTVGATGKGCPPYLLPAA